MIHPSHVERYEFAKKYTAGKVVLDDGCADGFGFPILSENAAKVVGVDNDPSLVAMAKEQYKALKNVDIVVGDVRELPFEDNTFDVAVSFEVIEHFTDQETFLKELRRVVKNNGIVILSTPDHNANQKIGVYHEKHEGHGHPGELTFPQFFYLMNRHFFQPEFYGQFFYEEPSRKDRMLNLVKRADVLKLRKILPQKTRDKHNLSVHIYEQDFHVKKLDGPAVQMLAVATNKK